MHTRLVKVVKPKPAGPSKEELRAREEARRMREEAEAEAAAANRRHGYSTRKRNATKSFKVNS